MELPANDGSFVFHGTVIQPNATTMPQQAPASSSTAIVHVDEVVLAPPALAGYAGQRVTVVLQSGEQLKTGERATFFTNGSVFGDSVVVRSEGHRDIATATAALGPQTADPVRNAVQRKALAHADEAQTVVAGTVTSTHLATVPPVAAQSALELSRPVSEHDPEWHDAVVDVSGVQKGNVSQAQVVVRYPNSMDVRWYQVPKLRPGMTGTFILHSDEPPAVKALAAAPVAAGAPPVPAYVLLHAEDFQPRTPA